MIIPKRSIGAARQADLLQPALEKMANDSFNAESKIYAMANLQLSNAAEVYAKLQTQAGWDEYQSAIQNALLGPASAWAKYIFYYGTHQDLVAAFGKRVQTSVFDDQLYNVRQAAGKYGYGRELTKSGTLDTGALQRLMIICGETILNRFHETVSKMEGDQILKDDFFDALADAAVRGIFGGRYFMISKGTKKLREKGDTDRGRSQEQRLFTIVDELDDQGNTQKIYKVGQNNKIEIPVFTVKADFETKKYENLELNQRAFHRNTIDAIGEVLANPKYKDLKLNGKGLYSENSDFLVSLQAEGIDLNGEQSELNYQKIAEIFLDTLYEVVEKNIPPKDRESLAFTKDMVTQYENALVNVLKSNPSIISQFTKMKGAPSVSGTIGETMLALFLSTCSDNYVVQVLGQEYTSTGQNAIDIALFDAAQAEGKRKTGLGFQSKAGISFHRPITIYNTTIKAFEDKNRYIDQTLDGILEIYMTQLWVYRKYNYSNHRIGGGAAKINYIQAILLKCVDNFIRFGQVDQLENIKDIKNNFYAINFNFIPSSVIFYSFYKATTEAISNDVILGDLESAFAFTSKSSNMGGKIEDAAYGGYLLDTWDQCYLDIFSDGSNLPKFDPDALSPYVYEDDDGWAIDPSTVPDRWRENLYLQFGGIQLDLYNGLKVLLNRAM